MQLYRAQTHVHVHTRTHTHTHTHTHCSTRNLYMSGLRSYLCCFQGSNKWECLSINCPQYADIQLVSIVCLPWSPAAHIISFHSPLWPSWVAGRKTRAALGCCGGGMRYPWCSVARYRYCEWPMQGNMWV